MTYKLQFWGTRGSIPAPGPGTVRYGGNTPCVSLDAGNGRVLILDAGTGVRRLGHELMARSGAAIRAQILLSHTHWDHIQGLPFFAPFFSEGSSVAIWGSEQADTPLDTILRRQMEPVVFPVPLDAVQAELGVHHLNGQPVDLDEFDVRMIRLRHPGVTYGYRITPKDRRLSMVYVTDNELGPGGDYDVPPDWRKQFVAFIADADILIHDAMYTPDEMARFAGWGHSSYTEAIDVAREAGVKQLALFHHAPDRTDDAIDEILEHAATLAGSTLDVFAAQEGHEVVLS